MLFYYFLIFFFSSRRRHTRCALVTGVQTCALPIFGKAHRNSGKERPTRLRPVPENGNDAIHGSASPFRHPGLVPGSNAPTACHRVLKFGCRNKSGMTEGKYALDRKSTRLNSSH